MDRTMKVYTLDEVKEELIDNKDLYDFKLWISIELEHIINNANRSKDPAMYCRNKIGKILNKIENG